MYGKNGKPSPSGISMLIIVEYKMPPKALLNFVWPKDFESI